MSELSKGGRTPYGKIVRKTWNSKRFKVKPRDTKCLLAYLWSNEHATGNPGLYRLPILTIVDEVDGIDIEQTDPIAFKAAIEAVRAELIALADEGWIKYDFEKKIVFCTKWHEYDAPDNVNVAIGMLKRALDLPATPIFKDFYDSLCPFLKATSETISERLGKPLHERLQKRFAELSAIPLPIPFPEGSANGSAIPEPEPDPEPEPYPEPQPSAPTAPIESQAEKLTRGDYVAAVKEYFGELLPCADMKHIGGIAGNIANGLIVEVYFKDINRVDTWPPPEALIAFLKQVLDEHVSSTNGRPKTLGSVIAYFKTQLKDPAKVMEYASESYKRAGW